MSYYPRGRGGDDDGDDFDEYDPTPYGGGYDQSLTYGRPLSPSDEICYPSSSASGHNDFDYERPSYTSSAQPSAYADEALDNEYKSYDRPKPRPSRPTRPAYDSGSGGEYGGGGGIEYGGRPSAYGSQAPTSGYGGGRVNEYDTPPTQEYGSGYGGGRPQYEAPTSGYGGGRKNEYESEYHDAPSSGYGGSGYGGRKSENEYEAPGQGYGSGYGRKSGYDEPSSEYGSGYEKKSGYGRKSDDEDDDKPRYGGSSYGRKSDDDDDKPRYGQEGYGRKKYGGDDSDDDDEKKQRHHHHNRRHYDD